MRLIRRPLIGRDGRICTIARRLSGRGRNGANGGDRLGDTGLRRFRRFTLFHSGRLLDILSFRGECRLVHGRPPCPRRVARFRFIARMGLLDQGFISSIETRFNTKSHAAIGTSRFFFDPWSNHDSLFDPYHASAEIDSPRKIPFPEAWRNAQCSEHEQNMKRGGRPKYHQTAERVPVW